jgi:hypothetical protein
VAGKLQVDFLRALHIHAAGKGDFLDIVVKAFGFDFHGYGPLR